MSSYKSSHCTKTISKYNVYIAVICVDTFSRRGVCLRSTLSNFAALASHGLDEKAESVCEFVAWRGELGKRWPCALA
jgi:hypothetical protein